MDVKEKLKMNSCLCLLLYKMDVTCFVFSPCVVLMLMHCLIMTVILMHLGRCRMVAGGFPIVHRVAAQ